MPHHNTTTLKDLFETKNPLERRLFKIKFCEYAGIKRTKLFYDRVQGKTKLTASEAAFVAEWFEIAVSDLLTAQEVEKIAKIPAIRENREEYTKMNITR